MYHHRESKPIRSLKDKYKVDKRLSLIKSLLNETSFNSIGLGEFKEKSKKKSKK